MAKMDNTNRIFAKGGFEFRLVKDENDMILSQFRFRQFIFGWSKWYDWFYSADIKSGIEEVMRIKDKYDGKNKKIRTPVYPILPTNGKP